MQIHHYGHAAVLIQTATARILLDPGNLCTAWHDLIDLDAVLITHLHPDHVDPVNLPRLLARNPQAVVYQEKHVPATLTIAGARELTPETSIRIGALSISAVGRWHAIIHPELPTAGNIGVIISGEGEPTFFHPGDCLNQVPEGINILALPVHGPWAAMREHVEFLRAVGADHAFGIHEKLLSEAGWSLAMNRYREMSSTVMHDLRDRAKGIQITS